MQRVRYNVIWAVIFINVIFHSHGFLTICCQLCSDNAKIIPLCTFSISSCEKSVIEFSLLRDYFQPNVSSIFTEGKWPQYCLTERKSSRIKVKLHRDCEETVAPCSVDADGWLIKSSISIPFKISFDRKAKNQIRQGCFRICSSP